MKIPKNEPPLEYFCRQQDLKNLKKGGVGTEGYLISALNNNLTGLLKQEIEFRAKYQMNIISSVSGFQGSGKSLGMLYFCSVVGKIYGVPFSVENIVYSDEELDKVLSEIIEQEKKGVTIFRDEQPGERVGTMSWQVWQRLQDYEKQLRRLQVNILFANPTLERHAHFFVFRTYKIFRDSKAYPTGFRMLLFTPRILNPAVYDDLVARGFVDFPIPPKQLVQEYDARHLQFFKEKKQQESVLFQKYEQTAKQIAESVLEKGYSMEKGKKPKSATFRAELYRLYGLHHCTKEFEPVLLEMANQEFMKLAK